MLEIINKLKIDSEKKIKGISLRVPESLKNEFDVICKNENIPLNSLIISLMIQALEDYKKAKK